MVAIVYFPSEVMAKGSPAFLDGDLSADVSNSIELDGDFLVTVSKIQSGGPVVAFQGGR
jgi:hypothetical protein